MRSGVTQAFAHGPEGGGGNGFHAHAGAEEKQKSQRSRIRNGVGIKKARDFRPRQQHGGEQRSEEVGEAVGALQHRARAGEFAALDDLRNNRLARRQKDGGEDCDAEGESAEHQAVHVTQQVQCGNGRDKQHAGGVGENHHALAVQAVDEGSGKYAEQHRRQVLGHADEAGGHL